MSGDGSDDDDKPHDPTQRRLEDARAKGEVVRSTELTTAATYAGFVLALIGLGGAGAMRIGGLGQTLLAMPDRLASGWGGPEVGRLMGLVVMAVLPVALVPAVLVLAVLMAQRAVVFAPEKLMPRLSRISILGNAGRKFGRNGLFEFGKSFVKLIVVGALLAGFLTSRMPEVLGTLELSPGASVLVLTRLLVTFVALVAAISVVIGALDYLWQYFEFMRRNRMSRRELIDELKDQEGDPQMKQHRRRRGYEIAMNRMIADVKKTDVVIVNPTHYAVALKWRRGERRAPICLAKGVDEVAARIRAAASEAGVPIRSDPPTARLLYAEVELGAEILPTHYSAVAAAIRFAETMRSKARRGWR